MSQINYTEALNISAYVTALLLSLLSPLLKLALGGEKRWFLSILLFQIFVWSVTHLEDYHPFEK